MDQLKVAGAWLRKNYFWVGCGLVTLLALGAWWSATSKLAKEAEDRAKAIEGKEQTGSRIASQANHPNTVTQTHMDGLIEHLVDDVYDAWQQQYDKQSEILTWPSQFGSDFLSIVSRLQPIEAKIKFPPEREQLNLTQRQQYRDFIYSELPRLAEVAGAEWTAGRAATTGVTGRSPTASSATKRPVVVWNSSDQRKFEQSRFSWGGRIPTTLDVLYAQEDLWVLHSIMQIVKATNGDAEFRFKAAVKTIEFIDIGRDAMGLAGQISSTGSSMAAMGGVPGMSGSGSGDGGMMAPGMSSMGGGSVGMIGGGGGKGPMSGMSVAGGDAAAASADPGDYRYVDQNFEPIAAQRIRAAFESNSPDDAFLIVAKRIPVRMRLRVDQRKLPRLLAECGNASLQLEIKQVRINRPAGRSNQAGGVGGAGGMSDGGMDGGIAGMGGPPGAMAPGGMDGSATEAGLDGGLDLGGAADGPPGMASGNLPGMPAMGRLGGASTSGQGLSDDSPYDVDVELYGIVYIYNPVNREKLGKKLEETPAANTPETPPADTPPVADAAG